MIKTTRDRLIEYTPLLQLIQHHQLDTGGKRLIHINTLDGQAVPKEYVCGVTYEISPYTPERPALEIAMDSLLRVASRELTFLLGGKQTTDTVHVPINMKVGREWVLLCSNETFYRFLKAEPYSDSTVFNPVAQRYYYDGLRLQRHEIETDIFLDTQRSHVYNFEAQFIVNDILENVVRYELRIRGYWLITTG